MTSTRCLIAGALAIGFFALPLSSLCLAQQDGGAEQVTKVYFVADLLFVAPNYPYLGINGAEPRPPVSTGQMGGGGGGMGGGFGGGGMGGGGGGGGFFSVPDDLPSVRLAQFVGFGNVSNETAKHNLMAELVSTIVQSIDSNSWSQEGGPGSIVSFQNRLVVTQTLDVHKKIEELLLALRAQGATRRTITIRAWWLRLNDADYGTLTSGMPTTSPPLVDRKQLAELAGTPNSDHGEVTCFDGQTVHIISGRFRNAVSSVIPVVGMAEPMATPVEDRTELAAADSDAIHRIIYEALATKKAATAPAVAQVVAASEPTSVPQQVQQRSVGYQPVTTMQHSGALLEFTPTRLYEEKAIVLDLRSVVTQWSDKPEKDIEFSVVPLDRTMTVTQQLETTLKLPLRKPVLVGGLSLEPGAAVESKRQLYLVVEATDESTGADSPQPVRR